MSRWSPTFAELTLPFKQPRPFDLSLRGFAKGIDNAHVDVFLSPHLTRGLREIVRKLLMENLSTLARRAPGRLVDAHDLESFGKAYVSLFEAALQRVDETAPIDTLALLQLSVVKCLLEIVADEIQRLQSELKNSCAGSEIPAKGRRLEPHDELVILIREEPAIYRRILHLLFRKLRELEDGHPQKLRTSLAGEPWPLQEAAFFNPLLLTVRLGLGGELAQDYPVAALSENGDIEWMIQANQCICKIFQHYLPPCTRSPAGGGAAEAENRARRERRDQGSLRGFLETEMLLSRFLSPEEYESGLVSWLDEPHNLRLFLDAEEQQARADREAPSTHGPWSRSHWPEFLRAVKADLFHCLDLSGLSKRVVLLYQLPGIRRQLGRPLPLSLLQDFVDRRLPRRRLAHRVESMGIGLEAGMVARVLERTAAELDQLPPAAINTRLKRFLVDFLRLRRDLKLAYWTYLAMDGIRLIEDPDQVRLSRSNTSLQEFPAPEEPGRLVRHIRSHVVIKADLRGSTQITERLRATGLNPASHFSLNFFDPVNKLLTDVGADKLFVEGDAVILAIFEHEGQGRGLSVSRACALAQQIVQVVSLQNSLNRKHGLPELEVGLGIAFSPKEPNFLFDEGRKIMISGAINRADRLSSCSSLLRRNGFAPENDGTRVAVLRMKERDGGHEETGDMLGYNVNGVRLEEAAFLKLQQEIDLGQVRPSGDEAGDNLFFSGFFPDLAGRHHWLAVRYAPVREWDGQEVGQVVPDRRHYFEVIVDEGLATRIRRLAADTLER